MYHLSLNMVRVVTVHEACQLSVANFSKGIAELGWSMEDKVSISQVGFSSSLLLTIIDSSGKQEIPFSTLIIAVEVQVCCFFLIGSQSFDSGSLPHFLDCENLHPTTCLRFTVKCCLLQEHVADEI